MTTTYERHQSILRRLETQGSVRVTDLALELDASEGTIRNDLIALEEQHLLERIRGGAIPVNRNGGLHPFFDSRIRLNADSKKKIARWAAELVSDSDVILLDASSTSYHMALYLEDRHNITVVTHHLETARLLNEDPTKRVILLGGYLRRDGMSVSGAIGQEVLKTLHLNTAFLSCVGFSLEVGLMEADTEEANLKQQIMQSASRIVALVDSSKFGKVGLKPFAAIEQVSHLVTDDAIDPLMVERLLQSQVAMTICGESSVESLTPAGSAKKHFRIGFANLSEELPFSIDVRRGLERAAKGFDYLDFVYVDNQLDGRQALRVVNELISRDVDLVIEYQIDEQAGNIIMNQLKQRHIPVIAVDIPMIGATYFGVDNFTAGHMAGLALGRWIQDHWQGQVDRVIVLEEKRAGTLPAARIQGQLSGLNESLGHLPDSIFTFVDSGNSAGTSHAHVLPLLRQLPPDQRVAFVCFNDDAAVGALQAVRELGLEGRAAIVGQGADRQIRDEIRNPQSPVIGSTAFMPELYGEKLIELALKILNGIPVPPAVYMDHRFIDKHNVD